MQYGRGRTRALPSLPQVLAENGLPQIAPLAKGERVMLERNRLDTFYRELQKPSRIEVNERTAKSNGATDCSEKTPGENQNT
jgi:hypothetical protein